MGLYILFKINYYDIFIEYSFIIEFKFISVIFLFSKYDLSLLIIYNDMTIIAILKNI